MDQAESLRRLVKLKSEINIKPLEDKSIKDGVKIYAITSGKGGVGKTSVTVNTAISLAKQNKKVLVLDADMGTANVDIMCGIFPKYNISHVIKDRKPIEDVIVDGPCGIKILPGVSGLAELTEITEADRLHFFNQLEDYQKVYKPDIILTDTGAGISSSVVNFLLAADEVIVVVTSEPTSISDAYAIIKTLNQHDTAKKVNVVVNLIGGKEAALKVFNLLNNVSTRFLQKDLYYLGYITYNKIVSEAVKMQRPITLCYPNSDVSLDFLRLSTKVAEIDTNSGGNVKDFFALAGRYFGWGK